MKSWREIAGSPLVFNIMICLVILSVFTGDYLAGHLVHLKSLFVLPIIMTAFLQNRQWTWFYISACSLMTLLNFGLATIQGQPTRADILNLGITVFLIWACGAISLKVQRAEAESANLRQLVTMCAWTKKVKVDGQWMSIEEFLKKFYNLDVTHGITDEAAQKMIRESSTAVPKPKRTEIHLHPPITK